MSKRFLSVFSFALIAAMLLTACGGGAAATTPTGPAAGGQATEAMPTTAAATDTVAATMAVTDTVAATSAAGGNTTPAAGTETPAAGTSTPAAAAQIPVTGKIDCMGAKQGDTLSLLYQWSGTEESNLNKILKPLADACGITLKPESTRDQALLDTRVKAGTPPDIAFWNITQLQQYQDILKPMDSLGVNADNYADTWKTLGTVNGKWLGLPVKTDIKTIIWYSPANFQALGYTVPKTWDELNTLVEKMVADKQVPWSMGFESGDSTGWTGADTIEDILLVQKGPDYVNGLITGKTPYNDAGVQAAWQTYGKWAKDAKYTVGGAQGTLSTAFNDAIFKVFSDPPQAMMVRQSGFAGGSIASQYPKLKYGTDYDFFQVPDAQGMQAGFDWMMAFSDKPAVKALVAYLSSDYGGQMWAQTGFDLTPNKAGQGAYTDPALKKKGDLLYSAKTIVPSIGDVIPGGFGTAQWKGIVSYVNGGDLNSTLSSLAAAQAQAVKTK
jgi:alpha-glucoside transport system substrate-binding protein